MATIATRPPTTASPRGRLGRSTVYYPLANKFLLANAWKRVTTSRNATYKDPLRLEIEAFGAASQPLLQHIYSKLRNRTYQPEPAYRVHFPKSKYADRTYTLLSVPDWVVYNAIVTSVAEAALRQEKDLLYDKVLFSNVPLSTSNARPIFFFRRWQRQYAKFNKASKNHATNGFPFLAEIDIVSFYDFIDHQLLLHFVRRYFNEVSTLDLLGTLLTHWVAESGKQVGHGIPQGPEASAFLADLFLYELDRHMLDRSASCRYARYVDDIRVFCKTRRRAEAEIIHVEEQIKRLGLVPNSLKVRIVDTRANSDWLKEESSEALSLDNAPMNFHKRPKSARRLQHLLARPVFLANCKKDGSTTETYLTRRSLPKLLPDQKVVERIVEVYDHRNDLHDLFFMYLGECKGNTRVSRFCQRQLSRLPVRDWECANLFRVWDRILGKGVLGPVQTRLVERYVSNGHTLPLSASTAASTLLRRIKPKSLAAHLKALPEQSIYLARWLPPAIRLQERKKALHRSVKSRLQALFAVSDPRTSFVASYVTSTKFPKMVSSFPPPASPYSRIILRAVAHSTIDPSVDEIAPLLQCLFRLKVPPSFDFRKKLDSLTPGLYVQAVKHLRQAARYVDTSPTHFVNQIHNFNHILLHFALHNGGYVVTPIQFRNTFRQIQPGTNPSFQNTYPTLSAVFLQCSQIRNTNVLSHPYDNIHSRFSNLVTYPQRDKLIPQLRAGFQEFIAKT